MEWRTPNYLKYVAIRVCLESSMKYMYKNLILKNGLKLLFLLGVLNTLYGLKSIVVSSENEVEHSIQIIHKGISTTEVIECTLVEIQNDRKRPVSFYMDVESVVCGDKQCRVDIVRIYWDNLGRFDQLSIPNGIALEKAKGEHFTAADYQKLDKILKDENSPLAEVYKNEVVSTGAGEGIDGMSGATVLIEKNAFVEGAVWTCYSLWHWVHGETQQIIRNITGADFSITELQDLLKKGRVDWQYFAIEEFIKRKEFSPSTVTSIISAIQQDATLLKKSLQYWELAPNAIYTKTLSKLIEVAGRKNRLLILDKLLKTKQALTIDFFNNLPLTMANFTYPELTKFLLLLDRHQVNSTKLTAQLLPLLNNNNFLIARRTYWFLSEQPLSEEQAKMLAIFFLENEDRL